MSVRLPEILRRPPRRRHDIIRLAATTAIMGSELGLRIETEGNYTPVQRALIYGGAVLALGLGIMPANRLMENYYGNYDDQGRELNT